MDLEDYWYREEDFVDARGVEDNTRDGVGTGPTGEGVECIDGEEEAVDDNGGGDGSAGQTVHLLLPAEVPR